MPFALILIGLILVISAARGTHKDLGALVKGDFTGPNNFAIWLIAIGVLGLIGYNDRARGFSRAFMALVLIAMILSNGGVFRKFVDALSEMQDGGSSGAGVAGNTLAGTETGSSPTGEASTGRTGVTRDEAQGLATALPSIMKTIANPIGTATSVLKSVPVLGGLF